MSENLFDEESDSKATVTVLYSAKRVGAGVGKAKAFLVGRDGVTAGYWN